MEQPGAEGLQFPALHVLGQVEEAEVSQQVLGEQHQLQPDLVHRGRVEGELASPVSLPQRMQSWQLVRCR